MAVADLMVQVVRRLEEVLVLVRSLTLSLGAIRRLVVVGVVNRQARNADQILKLDLRLNSPRRCSVVHRLSLFVRQFNVMIVVVQALLLEPKF